MKSSWLDLLLLVLGAITASVVAYCTWDMIRSWRAGRTKPANRARDSRNR